MKLVCILYLHMRKYSILSDICNFLSDSSVRLWECLRNILGVHQSLAVWKSAMHTWISTVRYNGVLWLLHAYVLLTTGAC